MNNGMVHKWGKVEYFHLIHFSAEYMRRNSRLEEIGIGIKVVEIS